MVLRCLLVILLAALAGCASRGVAPQTAAQGELVSEQPVGVSLPENTGQQPVTMHFRATKQGMTVSAYTDRDGEPGEQFWKRMCEAPCSFQMRPGPQDVRAMVAVDCPWRFGRPCSRGWPGGDVTSLHRQRIAAQEWDRPASR